MPTIESSSYSYGSVSDRAPIGKKLLRLAPVATFVGSEIILATASCSSGNAEASPPTGTEAIETNNVEQSKLTRNLDNNAEILRNEGLKSGTIEFSFLGVTIKLADLDTESFKLILGVLIFLFGMKGVLSSYNTIRRKHSTTAALQEAENTFKRLIDELYDTLQHISAKDANLVVVSDNMEQQFNVFEKKITEIRSIIKTHWVKYQGKVDPKYSAAIEHLYQTTIQNPYDIDLMKSAAEDLCFAGKNNRLLDHSTIKFFENLSIQLSNQKK